ncbi:MAG: hypothetical protein HY907_12180 [Deltaproteobacteria bacterium]|nr:hypothetical protein [Deltaproteobacteria bacterium]
MTRESRSWRAAGMVRIAGLLAASVGAFGVARTVAADGEGQSFERPRLEIATEDGQSSIRLRLAAQFRWEGTSADKGDGADRDWTDRILFRRLRVVFEGSAITEDLTYRLHLNFVPGLLELDDLWIAYKLHDQARLLLGQNKVPFTRYRIDSFQDLPLTEWGYETPYFGGERQIGLTLHNGMDRPPEFEYEVGIYTGVNARASNGIGIARTFAETPPNPSLLTDPAPPSSFHPELVVHLAYNYGGIDVRKPSDLEGGPFRFSVGVSAAWDAQPDSRLDFAMRLAPEVLLKVGGFHALGVFYLGFWDQSTGDDSMALGMFGGVAQMSYVFLDMCEVSLRYSTISILEDLRNDARAWADQRIAAETDPDEQAALVKQYRDTGHLLAEHEVLLGFNVYLLGTTLKLQVDGGVRIHERSDADRHDGLVRTQIQLAF